MGNQHEHIAEFWAWLQSHSGELNRLTNTANPSWDEVLNRLKRLDSRLWFEVSVPPKSGSSGGLWLGIARLCARLCGRDGNGATTPDRPSQSPDREFIITAHGQPEAFPVADTVVSQSPHLPGWRFMSLKPPLGFDFEINYEGTRFDPRDMWFALQKTAPQTNGVRLQIAVPGFVPANERVATNAVAVILATGLGERSASLDIEDFELTAMPTQPATDGYTPLPGLADCIEQHRTQKR